MEYLDIYNEKGEKLGYVKTREKAHKEGLWHKIACVFIINSVNEIMMQKRSPLKITNPNGWTCSASGHIDAGEDTITGGLRELEEEIGVKASKDDLKYIGTVFEDYISNNYKIKHIADVYLLYRDINVNDLKLQKEEVSEAKYYNIKEIEKLDFSQKHRSIYKLLRDSI